MCVDTNPNQKTLAIKKLQPRPERGCDEKDLKSKGTAKACAGMLLITLKFLIMMIQAPQTLKQQKCFVVWVIIIKIVNVINSILAQTLADPF